jgi:hypothetical protein
VNLPVTDVTRCTSSSAKALELENLQLLNAPASGVPPDGERTVHHWEDKLYIQQNSVFDGEAASSLNERAKDTQLLGGLLSGLSGMGP